MRAFLLLFVLLLVACEDAAPPPPVDTSTPSVAAPSAAPSATLPPRPWKAAAIAHGGVGSPPERSDGCRKAVDAALAALDKGVEPLDAAVEGVVVLEDDPRFNAGTGSRVRIDRKTVQMDASVMDSSGRFGAVAVIEQVRNPVRVARAVVDTPHLVIAGDGATALARTLGFPPYDPSTPEMREEARKIQEQLRKADPSLPEAWKGFDWRARWNFERTLEDAGLDPGSDTVGVAVRAPDGKFAVALSTGGTTITLSGRVGDVPIYGAGLYAGTHGAAAATGTGERIIEQSLAMRTHEWLAGGATPKEAAERAVERLKGRGAIGIIVVGPRELAAAADRPMAWASREAGASAHQGP
jgi:isoaspartyl peptidase/L-asparaginase-like protein (Ntn-hydrolase superfamily)